MNYLLPIFVGLFLLNFNAHSQTPGNALNFDGTDDYIDCPLPTLFNSIDNNDFTVELWAMPTLGAFQRIFFAQFDADNFTSISLNPTGEVAFYLSENGVNHSVQSSSVLNSLEWAHIAVTWNSSTEEARIIINGSEAPYSTGLFVSSTGSDNAMTVASRTDGNQFFLGEIDELSIWDVAKSECEVSFESKDKKTGTEPNLVSYYSFDHGTASDPNPGVDFLQDFTGNLNDGVLTNFALAGSSSNWVVSLAEIVRFWGDESPLFLGQLGLVSTIDADQYQWIYCNGTPIVGATNTTFDPATEDPNYTGTNDSYAVISTTGSCVDTSDCFVINNVGLEEIDLESLVSVYPNPSQGSVSIESTLVMERIEIRNITGELIEIINPKSFGTVHLELAKESGIYFVDIHTENGRVSKKVLVQNN